MISIDQGVSCCGWCQFGTCLNLGFIKTTAGKIKLAEIVSTLPGIINRTLAAFALNPVYFSSAVFETSDVTKKKKKNRVFLSQ